MVLVKMKLVFKRNEINSPKDKYSNLYSFEGLEQNKKHASVF